MGFFSYFIIVFVSIFFFFIVYKNFKNTNYSFESYIVDRNNINSITSISTLTSSMLGAWILFSPAEAGTWSGINGVLGYSIGQALPFVAFAIIGTKIRTLMPNGHSVTEYVKFRYGNFANIIVGFISVFYMMVFLCAELTGIASASNLIGNIPSWFTALIIGLSVATYVSFAGIKASIFTDKYQFRFIFPLILICVLTMLFDIELTNSFNKIGNNLLSFSNSIGTKFGLTLMIAILSANMFHQGLWQRIYSVKNTKSLTTSFSITALIVIPVVFIFGFIGIIAVGSDTANNPSIALFDTILKHSSEWLIILFLLLAVMLVSSSLDTLFNSISSIVGTDLLNIYPSSKNFVSNAMRFTPFICLIPAVFVASQEFSVLYLFLIADMVCSAILFPVFFGLYTNKFNGNDAVISMIVGLIVGTLLFAKPDMSPILNFIPYSGDLFASFYMAFISSTFVSTVLYLKNRTMAKKEFEYSSLNKNITSFKI